MFLAAFLLLVNQGKDTLLEKLPKGSRVGECKNNHK